MEKVAEQQKLQLKKMQDLERRKAQQRKKGKKAKR